MSTLGITKFNSPFTYNTFAATSTKSNKSVYQKRIIKIYTDEYPILNDFTDEQINNVLESRKLKKFKLSEKEKQDKQEKDDKKKDDKKPEEQKGENKDDKKDKKDDKKVDESKEKQEKKELELKAEEKKLIKALELLENEYYGNEHSLYVHLCNKYGLKIAAEYENNGANCNRISDKLYENICDIKCSECGEIKTYYDYNATELENGYFLACKECEPDRDSVKTMKWSEIYKSGDIVLKHNNFVCGNNRDSHRYACVDMHNAMKQGIHCFRWYVKGHRSWLLFGISHPKKHRDGSYSEPGVYGISSAGTYYKNGATMYDIPAAAMYEKAELLIDMKLDLSKYELSFMVVGDAQKRVMKMTGIEKNNKNGFIPHVNIYYQSVQLQIKKIPSSWFGKNPKRCKFKY